MMKPEFEVADVLRLYAEQYRQTHAMSEEQRLAMAATRKSAIIAAASGTATTPAATDTARNARS